MTGRTDASSASSPRKASPSRRIVASSARRIAIAIARSNARYPPPIGHQRQPATVTRHYDDFKISRRRVVGQFEIWWGRGRQN